MFFLAEYRSKISADDRSKLSVMDEAKAAGALWRELTDDDKGPYQVKAKEERERYAKELA